MLDLYPLLLVSSIYLTLDLNNNFYNDRIESISYNISIY